MAPFAPLACLAFVNALSSASNHRHTSRRLAFVNALSPTSSRHAHIRRLAMSSRAAVASLPSLNAPDGSAVPPDALADQLTGKRVALYFAAGWCPMCTSFEPSLLQFRAAALSSGKDVEFVYVPSDRSEADVVKRTQAMGMLSVPIGEEADAMKTRYKIWAGAESGKLGTGRRSGVPALVVLDGKKGEEMAFVAAESEGAKALSSWPLDNEEGLW